MQYFIVEIQHRPDGIFNQTLTTRQTLRTALSYYFDRASKAVANENFTFVTLVLLDTDGTILKNEKLTAAWVEPEEGEGE